MNAIFLKPLHIIDGLEGRVILSEKNVRIDPDLECARLLVVAPGHGKVTYTWERKDISKWVHVNVPRDTCLIYTRCQGMYSCEVSGEVYYFEVIGLCNVVLGAHSMKPCMHIFLSSMTVI